MTALTVPAAGVAAPSARTRARDLFGSEWIKLRSVRSTYFSMLAAAVLSIGVSAIACGTVASNWPHMSPADKAGFDPFRVSLAGLLIAQLAFGVLGVLAITSEHGTGMIRTTFAAVPHRRSVLLAKAAVLSVVAAPLALLLSFTAFGIGQAELASTGVSVSLSAPGAMTAVLGGAGYLMAVTLLGFGFGALIRHSAGAISGLFGLVLVLPMVAGTIPAPWDVRVGRLLPSLNEIVSRHVNLPGMFTPAASLLVCATWALAAVTAALLLVTRRDA